MRSAAMASAAAAITGASAGCRSPGVAGSNPAPPSPTPLSARDRRLLEELIARGLRFFHDAAHPETGHVLDRRVATEGPETRRVASIAATGFGLTALAVAHGEGRAPAGTVVRVERTLRHLLDRCPSERGFFYHFHDWETGARVWNCELSSIDTALLMAGVLACRSAFDHPGVHRLATALYERVEWPWMLAGGTTLSMGWFPERGFLASRWDHYCELMILYVLGLGSPTHALPAETWRAWSRPTRRYYGEDFVWSPAPLFVHQFSHAWIDFRGCPDGVDGTDWFANSMAATRAHVAWSLERRDRFPRWSEDLWGVTSSDSAQGYVGWGGPPDSGPLDGTIVPCAAAGSLPFLPSACLRTLHAQRAGFGDRVWGPYGFVDAFNPHTGWVNPDVIGIDVGITVLMAANLLNGSVWPLLGRDAAVREGLRRAGFR